MRYSLLRAIDSAAFIKTGATLLVAVLFLLFSQTPVVAADKSIFNDDMVVAALKILGGKKKAAPAPAPPPAPEDPPAEEPAEVEEPADEVAPVEEVAEEAAPEEAAPVEEVAEEVAPVEEAAEEEDAVEEEEYVEQYVEEDEEVVLEGELVIESKPSGIKVFVDGEELGVTPIAVEGLADTSHEVILYHPEKGAFSRMVESGVGNVFVDLTESGGLGVAVLKVETDPPNVRIDIDGKRAGLSPLSQPVVAGLHNILLSRDGYADKEIQVELEAGATLSIEETLEELPGSLLVIVTPSGGEVFLDGHSLGEATGPLRIADVPPGIHEMRVVKPGFLTWSRNNINVQRKKTETVLVALQPERSETNVRIYTEPQGARLWVDGKEVGVAGPDGVGFNTHKGTHILRMELNPAITPGYRPLQVSVSFTEDNIDYKENPIKLPIIDDAFLNAQKLFERGESEEAISYLDRVDPEKASYAQSRIMMIEILKELRRITEIPAEFEKLFSKPVYQKNPVLNLSMGYWTIQAAKQAGNAEAVDLLLKGLDALDRTVESMDYFPADERHALELKAHYYTGIASELLFGLSGEKKHVKKGVQAWEMFFARLSASEETLGKKWVDRAKNHQKNLVYLEKKLGQ